MSYQSIGHSNVFDVCDLDAFCSWAKERSLGVVHHEGDRVSLYPLTLDGWPGGEEEIETGSGDAEVVEIDFVAEVATFLAKGEVAIFFEIGFEGMQHLHGHAFAVNARGETVLSDLSEIYQRAQALKEQMNG